MLLGTYCGICENVNDPLKLGRVKVRVPHVYGASGGSGGAIGTNDLPWALPAGMPAGAGPASGGFSHLPNKGDHVYVRFLDGEPEKPIWEWGMQTQADAENLPLHQYELNGKTVGKPKRAAWTRYGHTLELNSDGVIVTTSQGYRATFTDGDEGSFNGLIQVVTPQGNMLEIDDEGGSWTAYAVEDLYLNVGDTITAQARALDFTMADSAVVNIGTTLDLIALSDINVETSTVLQLTFAEMLMGAAATQPFVLGTSLVTFLESLLVWLTTHTHGNGNLGSPTTPPIVPPVGVVQPNPTALISTTIFGQ